MTIARVAVAAALVASGACDTPCDYRIMARLEVGARAVGCCGAADIQDIVLPEQPDLAIDLAQVALSNRVGGQDLWLTIPDCLQLFDGPYVEPGAGPRPTPRCRVLLGPVAPGRVSPRTELPPGPYRVFVQSYTTNPATNPYEFTVGVWGSSCGGSPARP